MISLPITIEITSLPQLTPEGLLLALAHRAAFFQCLASAAQALEERGEAVTSRALAAAAHISREHRLHLAQALRNESSRGSTSVLSFAPDPSLRTTSEWWFA